MLDKIIHRYFQFGLYHDLVESLSTALETKDTYTSGHSKRVADMSYELCNVINIKNKEKEKIHIAAHVHDIGKIGIPDKILIKDGKLTELEYEYIKTHAQMGYDILNKSMKLNHIAKIVLHHHERWDGNGYPYGLKENEIPLGSRVIAVCDSIDAMTSKRSYREPLTWEKCKVEIISNKGLMYDPCIADYAIDNWERLKKIWMKSHK